MDRGRIAVDVKAVYGLPLLVVPWLDGDQVRVFGYVKRGDDDGG